MARIGYAEITPVTLFGGVSRLKMVERRGKIQALGIGQIGPFTDFG
jgi:hypothetical protein